MKKFSILFILALAFITSCQDDPPILTPNLVTIVKGFDLDNNANASDIRVDFTVLTNQHVEEYRVMIVPAQNSTLFTLEVATSIPSSSYVEIEPQLYEYNYSVNRLPPDILDVNGASIINDVEYVALILIKGVGDWQLSDFSKLFILKDQGIYNGHYFVHYNNICKGAEGSGDYIDLALAGGAYSGVYICPDGCNDQTLDTWYITVVEDSLLNVTTVWPDYVCGTVTPFPCSIDPCFYSGVGNGKIENELTFEIQLFTETCYGNCTAKFRFIRQP